MGLGNQEVVCRLEMKDRGEEKQEGGGEEDEGVAIAVEEGSKDASVDGGGDGDREASRVSILERGVSSLGAAVFSRIVRTG